MDLTPYEFSLLVDHNQKNEKQKYNMLRSTIYNSGANLFKGKNDKEIPLFNDDREDHNENPIDIQKEREMLFGNKSE